MATLGWAAQVARVSAGLVSKKKISAGLRSSQKKKKTGLRWCMGRLAGHARAWIELELASTVHRTAPKCKLSPSRDKKWRCRCCHIASFPSLPDVDAHGEPATIATWPLTRGGSLRACVRACARWCSPHSKRSPTCSRLDLFTRVADANANARPADAETAAWKLRVCLDCYQT